MFEREEIEEYLKKYSKIRTANSALSNILYLKIYTNWCRMCNCSSVNNYEGIKRRDIFHMFRERNLDRFLTPDEIHSVVSEFQNPTDRYIVLALYNGIKGEDYCEISLL
jgi:hypothetical protein